MEFTWGFLALFLIFVVPGLIIRRLYFYGEFSKQFGSGEAILKVFSFALIPGMINAIATFFIYDSFYNEIDLGLVVDSYKELANPLERYSENLGPTIKEKLRQGVLPFLVVLYTVAGIIGAISGRFVRMFGIDTRLKLFRFKNQWFYLFHGHHIKLRKFKYLKKSKKEFLFTQADLMIDSNNGKDLYSGIVVDYELKEGNCSELSRVILRNAKRYKQEENTWRPRPIPGDLFLVDCSKMNNINLTFVYGKNKEFSQSDFRRLIYRSFSIVVVCLILILIVQIPGIKWIWYKNFFELTIVGRIFYYFYLIQVIQFFNPVFENRKKKIFEWGKYWDFWIGKLLAVGLMFGIARVVELLSSWILSF